MEVQNLVTSLNSVVSNFLGANYSELKYKFTLEDNFTKGSTKKYGVVSGDINGTDGATCFVTVDQIFSVIITDEYKSLNVGDSPKDTVRKDLQDKSLDLYVEIINTKAGRSDIVMNITDLSSSIDDLEQDQVLACTLSFTIKYRKRV